MKKKIARVIRKTGGWYIADVKEIPGVNTQGRTLTKTRENLEDARRPILKENRR